MDRLLARLEQQRIWEHTPEAIDLDVRIMTEAMDLASQVDDKGQPTASPSIRLRAWTLVHTIIKETFIDRTIPMVTRVEASAAIMNLPLEPGAVPEQVAGSEEQASKAETIGLLRGILAKLENGDAKGEKPGLILLRDEERHAG